MGAPWSKPVLSFTPYIPKKVSNSILLLCGESSFTKGFGTEDQPHLPTA